MAVAEKQNVLINFSGGLNTETSPLGMDAKYAKAMSNIKINANGSIEVRPSIDFIGYSDKGKLFKSETMIQPNKGFRVNLIPFTYQDTTSGALMEYVLLREEDNICLYLFNDYDSLRNLPDAQPEARLNFAEYILNGSNPQTMELKFIFDSSVIIVLGDGVEPFFIERLNNTWVRNRLSLHRRKLGNDQKQNPYVRKYSTVFGGIRASYMVNPTSEIPIESNLDWASWPLSLTHKDYISKGEAHWEIYQAAHAEGELMMNMNYDDIWHWDYHYPCNIVTLAEYYKKDKISCSTGCVSNGRLWVSGIKEHENAIYYSQTIDTGKEYGRFYQFADPYRYIDNAVVDTDGGSITISGSGTILDLVPFGGGILVFATEGVWMIAGSGLGSGFVPTAFSIDKVSNEGIIGSGVYAEVEDTVVYLTKSGIYSTTSDQISGKVKAQKMSVIVDKLFDDIPDISKKTTKIHYNSAEKKIYFLLNLEEYVWMRKEAEATVPYRYNDILIYDVKLQAWSVYRLSSDDGSGVFITDLINVQGHLNNSQAFVLNKAGEIVTNFNKEWVISRRDDTISSQDYVTPVLGLIQDDEFSYAVGVMEASRETLYDFETYESDRRYVDAFYECAYIYDGDLMHQKQIGYLTTVFERMEEDKDDILVLAHNGDAVMVGIHPVGIQDKNVDFDIGGCIMRVARNFSVGDMAGVKYGAPFQAYKPWRSTTGYFEGYYPDIEYVQNKHKVRGRGTNLYIRIEREPGKWFKLYGIQIQTKLSKKAY